MVYAIGHSSSASSAFASRAPSRYLSDHVYDGLKVDEIVPVEAVQHEQIDARIVNPTLQDDDNTQDAQSSVSGELFLTLKEDSVFQAHIFAQEAMENVSSTFSQGVFLSANKAYKQASF